MRLTALKEVPSRRLFTRRQAQEYLGVSKRTILKMKDSGELPAYKLRGWLCFKLEDLEGVVDSLDSAT